MKVENSEFEPQCLTCNILTECVEFKASMDPTDWKYFLIDCQGPAIRHTKIFQLQGMNYYVGREKYLCVLRFIQNLDSSNTLRKHYEGIQKPKIFYHFPFIRHANVSLRIKLYLPPNLSRKDPRPLILHTSDEVEEPYAGYSPAFGHSHYLAVAKKWAVLEVDGRGKNLEGFTRLRPIKQRVGIVDLQDYSDAVTFVFKKYGSWLDPKKLGVWGRGYGGYTAACLTGAKRVSLIQFKCGAAVSPYARMYNLSHAFFGRHFPDMSSPWETTKPLIYTRADLLHRMRNMRNDSFLIIHGSTEREINVEQTMWLTKTLVDANVAFQQMILPDVDFSKKESLKIVYHKLNYYFSECFGELSYSSRSKPFSANYKTVEIDSYYDDILKDQLNTAKEERSVDVEMKEEWRDDFEKKDYQFEELYKTEIDFEDEQEEKT
ncbi:venom dipeptidyl peptidase 4-like [Orussus abietinus]|uniref:venom dipeptidyl peptidase 4-like n=1 Tax=Orussus abietinus TaxID=222816 RepID=UPI000C715E40|nr:venom dipeptidyl peptidase 4-like [Orussus abietinus]